MRQMLIKSLLLGVLAFTTLSAQQPTGRDIAQRVKDRPDGDSREAEMKMTLTNKRGSSRERRLSTFSIDVGQGKKDRKSILFFTYPGDVKGTGFLTWDYDTPTREDDKWLYLPAMKKTRRISGSSAKKDYFMGSDFTYDDMGSRRVDDDTHTLLGEETIGGAACWQLESHPKDTKDIYAKRISWIRKDCLIPVRVEYFDKMDKLQRRLEVSNIVKIGGFYSAQSMRMENVQTGHSTTLEFSHQRYNVPMDEGKFSVTTLEKGSF